MTVRVIDGHNPREIQRALEVHASHADNPTAKPFAIVALTVKGWGFTSVLESNSHGKPATEAEKAQALEALDAMAQHLGAALTKGDLRRLPVPEVEVPRLQPAQEAPSFREALRRCGQEGMLDKGAMAPRRAYGIALRALGHTYAHVVALDADVRNSTYSETFLQDEALRERFFECRIAEQNMLSCAAGLAAAGKLPFVSTFGKFLVRAYDQLEMGLISRFNLKLIGSHVGVSLAADGPSQMALPDVAFFRALTTVRTQEGKPLLYLLQPADAYAAYALTVAMAAHEGPCYLRTLRPDVPFLYNDATAFPLGGHHVLAAGHDLCILAAGYMVHEARQALALLKEHGIEATLVDLYSLPFNDVAILELAQENRGQVLTVEDNYGAGIGSAVADALALHGGAYTLTQMYVRQIPKSGRTPDEVLRSLQLTASDIVHTAVSMLDVASR
jgi:transketolase